jgi:hypothetical protein
MHARWQAGNASGWLRVRPDRAHLAALAAAAGLLAVGCASSVSAAGNSPPASSSPASAISKACGTTRTAANVPVQVQVEHGQASCATAMSVERAYAKAILAGRAPGNGGGGPVNINGWTCQGFDTPEVLKTGQASKCVRHGVEILAILPAPA